MRPNLPPNVQYVTTRDGVSIACGTLGAGPPLVVLPSGPWGAMQLEWQVPAWRSWHRSLAEGWEVVRYDSRGTGLSGGPALDFSLAAQLEDLAAVVDHAAPQGAVTLLAAQTAGPAALAYAARNPHRVSHLILWCTYARRSDYTALARADAFHQLLERDWELFTETATHTLLGWAEGETAHQLATLMRETFTPPLVRAFHSGADGVDVTPLLSRVQARTLVLQRQQAPPGVAVARGLASGIPGARLAVLAGESVAPFLGDTGAALRVIAEYLGVPVGSPPADPAPTGAAALPEAISPREREVLRWLATGRSNQEIARELIITVGTVKTHVQSLYHKLEVRNRTQAVARGRELHLIN